jgi:myo-inositol-1(or 4)-monophosphatase
MPAPDRLFSAPEADWLGVCRRAAKGVRAAVERLPRTADRAREIGRGEGGDTTLAVDQAAEQVVLAELEALGLPLTAVSEELGEVAIAGGGPARVVIDPIDGSLNAKRGLPFYSLSIAVAGGTTMADVELGYVADLASGQEWWARRGEGAFCDGERLPALEPGGSLELLGIESAHPRHVADAAEALVGTGAERLRAIGSIALALCLVAAGHLDAMLSLRAARSVDAAAGQLLVREAGGVVAFPDAGEPVGLDLGMRSRVVAATDPAVLELLLARVTA